MNRASLSFQASGDILHLPDLVVLLACFEQLVNLQTACLWHRNASFYCAAW